MDISGLDLTFFFGAIGTGAAAFIKAFRSDSNVKKANAEIDAINRDRENTALARDAQAQEMKTESRTAYFVKFSAPSKLSSIFRSTGTVRYDASCRFFRGSVYHKRGIVEPWLTDGQNAR